MSTEPEILEAPVSLTTPPSSSTALDFRILNASKINYLYEVSLSDKTKISETQLPLMNPYSTFAKPTSSISLIHSIRQLIRQTPKEVKEYVQSYKFDQHTIPTTENEYLSLFKSFQNFPDSGSSKDILMSIMEMFDLLLLFMNVKVC